MRRSYLYFLGLVKYSLLNLAQNKRRSLLTMLGVIIGVAAVIVIVGIGAGAQSLILGQIKTFGGNLIGVTPGQSEDNGPPASVMGVTITTLTYEDALALQDSAQAPHIVAVTPYVKGVETVSYASNEYTTNINGVNADYFEVEGGEISSGRFFSLSEERNLAKVAILGKTPREELFGDTDPIGRYIKIKNQNFEVIGVTAERGTVAFQDYDNQIILPVRTMQKLIAGVNHIGMIRAKVDNENNVAESLEDVKAILRGRHNISDQSGGSDDFSARSAAQALDALTGITDALRFFLAAMAALSLLVGGIGIMNIMLVRVSSRTREIGLRKALGATNRDVIWQFLLESSVLTLSGGLIGIILGEAGTWLIAVIARAMGYAWEYSLSLWSIGLAISVSVAVGIIFGLYPAKKAGKLSPMEALRYE